MDLLERYKKTLKVTTRGDQGITGVAAPGTYLGNTPGPMPPKLSPLEAEYDEGVNNQLLGQAENGGAAPNESDTGVIPISGFTQRYTPTNAYYTTNEGVVRANISTNDLVSSTKITALDVENPESGVKQGTGGGPNRTSAANGEKSSFLDGGDYKVLRYPTRAKFIDTSINSEDGGTLETMTLQQYTPNRTYLEVLADPNLDIERITGTPINQQPAPGGVPTEIDESIVPDNVKPKLESLKNFKI